VLIYAGVYSGAALANPFFEQVCCSKTAQDVDDEGKVNAQNSEARHAKEVMR
jgi:hypothetical protein